MRQVFILVDAKAILKIPICTRQVDDFGAWAEDPRGLFSVRSAYNMIFRIKTGREAWLEGIEDMSSNTGERRGWSSIWGMQVPSKLKVFTWRLAQHSLPMNDILHHRNMAQSHECAICGAADNWRHSMLDCTMLRSVWALASTDLAEHMCMNMDDSAKGWLFAMHESLPQQEFTTMIVTLWAIWHARRKLIHEGVFQTPLSTHSFISSYMSDLKLIFKPATRTRPATQPRLANWLPPCVEHAKLNIDAATPRAGGYGAVAVICRDISGAYQGASVVVFRNIDEPEVLECLAIREALALADDL